MLVKTFAKQGYFIIMVCRSGQGFKSMFNNNIDGIKIEGVVICGDVREDNTLKKIEDAIRAYEGVDILINNAGVYLNEEIGDITLDQIKETIETNLIAPIKLTKVLWPYIKGTVVNINSLAGKQGAYKESVYCASKHGLNGFSKALQYEGTKSTIKVLNVFVGAMRTTLKGCKDLDLLIEPQEVADLIIDLCEKKQRSLRITEITLTRAKY